MPLFFFVLDTIMVNSHLVATMLGCSIEVKDRKLYYHQVVEHLLFGRSREETIQLRSTSMPHAPQVLQQQEEMEKSQLKQMYVSKHFQPPAQRRINLPHTQIRIHSGAKMHCVYCRWQAKLANKDRHCCQTRYACKNCKVPLCRDTCFAKWHQ